MLFAKTYDMNKGHARGLGLENREGYQVWSAKPIAQGREEARKLPGRNATESGAFVGNLAGELVDLYIYLLVLIQL